MKNITLILTALVVFSCVKDESVPIIFDNTTRLSDDIQNHLYQTDAIFAFAASCELDSNVIDIFVVVEENAEDIKFYETNSANVNPGFLSNYTLLEIQPTLSSSDILWKFRHNFLREEWVIMTYRVENKIKLSSPIRIKNIIQQTQYLEDITINQEESTKPLFNWNVESYENNAFFFELMNNTEQEVLSLTLTNENRFRYFDLENVTLNLSNHIPPNLVLGDSYEFIVLDISIDNWINTVYSNNFIVE